MNHVFFCTGHEVKIPNIVKGNGIYVYDYDGKRYVDLEAGVWCVSVGHNNAEINKVIKKQVDSLMHAGFCYSNEILEKSAQSILNLIKMDRGKAIFLCSGSEAIEVSRQMAKFLTEKSVSMTLHDSYLGSYSSVVDRTKGWYLLNWERCKFCPEQEVCSISCEVLKSIPEDISEFIFEPGSSSGFVRFPPKALIHNIVKIVKENKGKIIVNEVTTGIGRTGKWFGYQHYDITPDFIAIGKGIGNGYPVSIALISEENVLELEKKGFRYHQSHQNDPLGASVALAVINYIKANNLIAKAFGTGLFLEEKLKSLVDREIILEVRCRGLMCGLDLKNKEIANTIFNALLDIGYIVGNRGSFFRIDPPLIISKSDIDAFVRVLEKVINF